MSLMGLLLAGLIVAVRLRVQEESESASNSKAREGGRVAVGEGASVTPAETTLVLRNDKRRGVTLPLPDQPLPGQNRAPCKRMGEVEIRGGCWRGVPDAKPPCKEEGKEEAYEWGRICYVPSYPAGREPISSPP
jgi:hypothetical protein